MTDEKWRSPNNDYGPEVGLDNGDVETFKKEPEEALARETGQNSNDARYNSSYTKMEYKLFEVEHDAIPGIDELSEMIEACYEYKKELPKEAVQLKRMLERSHDKKIKCLRISDFHTSGLEGVLSNDAEKPFYLLTKGSGISYKGSGAGGSKGIGKYAAFVNSNINTVFYSTYNKDNGRGYIGVSKLRSAPIPETDGLMTQGIAYFSRNDKKEPILEELLLDPEFEREEGNYGTDVYIIGFSSENDWKWSIISKLLESFMVAITEKTLIIDVDDITVSKETLPELINDINLKRVCGKRLYRDIQAQFALLYDEDIVKKTIDLDELGKVDVYVKKYDANHSDMATQKCVYVRYPYMKIKMSDNLSKLPFSAMCIIGDNEINSLLRDVENPQHTDWEFNRLNDDKPLKKKTRNAERLLREEIRKFVTEVMLADSSEKTDVLGAGEFLPSTEDGDMEVEVKTIKKDIVRTTKARKNKAANPKKEKANEDDDAFKHQNGSLTDDGDDGKKQNTGGGGEDNPYDDPNDQGGRGTATGNEPILKKVKLGGIKYKNIVVDEKAGRYDFRFTAPHDEADFELELKMCGDGSDTYTLDIISAEVDGKPCRIEDGKVRMKLSKDVTYVVKYTTNRKSMFSSEVIMNAYR